MTLGEVCIYSDDVPACARFYRTLLGLDTQTDDCLDAFHQFVIASETQLTVQKREAPCAGQSAALAFTVADVDAEYQRLCAMGVEVVQMPHTQPWGARNMIIKDPDGHMVYIRQWSA